MGCVPNVTPAFSIPVKYNLRKVFERLTFTLTGTLMTFKYLDFSMELQLFHSPWKAFTQDCGDSVGVLWLFLL